MSTAVPARIPANEHPFKEMEFSAEEMKAITSFRAAIHSALTSPASKSPSSPFYPFLASSPPLQAHWWKLFSIVIAQRRLQKRREIIEILEESKRTMNGDDSKLRAEEYEVDKKLSDFDLLRFLRARKMHEAEALKMILGFLKWRYDLGIASLNLLPEMPFRELLMAISPHMWHGVAKDQSLLYITSVGEVDANAFSSITTKEMFQICHAWDMESLVRRTYRHSATVGHRIPQIIFLMDFDGVSLSHAKCATAFKVTADIDQYYYPELLRAMIFVNAPSFFPVLWSLCKGFLDKKTQSKMQLYSASTKHKLHEFIEPDQLPMELGGNGRCACKKHGGGRFCVPRRGNLGFWEFTVKKPSPDAGLEIDESMSDWKAVTVKAKRKYEVTFGLVPGPEDHHSHKDREDKHAEHLVKLEWEFEVKSKDVQFSAEFIADYAGDAEEQHDAPLPSPAAGEREKAASVSSREEHEAKTDEEAKAVEDTAAVTSVALHAKSVERLPDHLVIHEAKRVAGKQRGEFLLPSRAFGTVRFVFSNEYSRWNSKEVHFKISRSTMAPPATP